jgi:large subunit ribosomal protein L29|tara:strand:- start:447 stop:653 length:207 start_codon:yes stop_codon:yes gene_type:complete
MALKIKEIREMSKEDLNNKLEELRKELIKLNTQIARGTTPKSPGQVKQIKKAISRILLIKTKEEIKKA